MWIFVLYLFLWGIIFLLSHKLSEEAMWSPPRPIVIQSPWLLKIYCIYCYVVFASNLDVHLCSCCKCGRPTSLKIVVKSIFFKSIIKIKKRKKLFTKDLGSCT